MTDVNGFAEYNIKDFGKKVDTCPDRICTECGNDQLSRKFRRHQRALILPALFKGTTVTANCRSL